MLAEKLLEGYSGFYGLTINSDISDPITYLNEACVEAITALQEAAQQYYVADIIGQSEVILEGYTGEVLTESVGSKIKQLWDAFKRKVKEIIGKVIEKIRKVINWIKSKFSKNNSSVGNDVENLVEEIEDFDPEEESSRKTTNSSQQSSNREEQKRNTAGEASAKEDVPKKEETHSQQSSNIKKETTQPKPNSNSGQASKIKVPLYTDSKPTEMPLPVKDIHNVPVPNILGRYQALISNVDSLAKITRDISDNTTDVLSSIMYDIKKYGWDDIKDTEEDDYYKEKSNEKQNNMSFEEHFMNASGKPSVFKDLSPDGVLRAIDEEFDNILKNPGVIQMDLSKLAEEVRRLDLTRSSEFTINHLNARIKTLEKNQKIIEQSNPPADSKCVNLVVKLAMSQITNGISGANFEIALWNKHQSIGNKVFRMINSVWNNYKSQVVKSMK